ncbi:MAG: hypothetical protein AAB352_03300 [Patescibacteria group bacterium]
MKKISFLLLSIFISLTVALPVAAEEMQTSGGFSVIINIITLIVVGGIMYNLWVNMSGFGGAIGKSLKIMSAGILILAIDTIHSSIQEIPGVGIDFLFGRGLYHDYFHCIITLVGFLVLGFGLASLSKLIKSMK